LAIVLVQSVVVNIATFPDGRVFIDSRWADDPGKADRGDLTLLFCSNSNPSIWVMATKHEKEFDR
jgi:hypothetical protein